MRNCQITFKENDQLIIVDFKLEDNGDADYNVRFHPEVNNNDNIGLAGELATIFIQALHENGDDPETVKDNNEG